MYFKSRGNDLKSLGYLILICVNIVFNNSLCYVIQLNFEILLITTLDKLSI